MMKLNLYNSLPILIILVVLSVISINCSSPKQEQQKPQTITVELKSEVNNLYFDSKVAPIRTNALTTNIDGFITKMYFKYGLPVAKDQLLFVIDSTQLVTDYRSALTDYLKSSQDYYDNLQKLQGSEELKKYGIIAEQEYRATKSQFFNSTITLAQSKRKLEDILVKEGLPISAIKQLNTQDPKSVEKLLSSAKTTINIFSPVTGIILPGDSGGGSGGQSGGGSSSSTMSVGSQVKAGQALASVGDKSGLSFDIKVNEIDINDIPFSQSAVITGDGFPGITLHGVVFFKDRFPTTDSGGVPTYMVHIIVPSLDQKEKDLVRIGMSAQVNLAISRPATIKVPLSAVTSVQGKSTVNVVDKSSKKIKAVPVETGVTTQNSVEILSGLNSGDEVVLNAPGN